jgi:hypothetical protein
MVMISSSMLFACNQSNKSVDTNLINNQFLEQQAV